VSALNEAGAGQRLRSYIDRILRVRADMDAMQEDVKSIYAEAKSEGFDKTVMGQLVAKLRKAEKDGDKAAEQAAILDLYTEAYHEAASHTHTREAA
jgi:uncharacterized protein (UPF0335 family)